MCAGPLVGTQQGSAKVKQASSDTKVASDAAKGHLAAIATMIANSGTVGNAFLPPTTTAPGIFVTPNSGPKVGAADLSLPLIQTPR